MVDSERVFFLNQLGGYALQARDIKLAKELYRKAADGDPSIAADVARTVADRTGGSILTTLGGSGALLTTPDGTWYAEAPRITVRSTVGAGDASLAGYLIAHQRGASPEELLRSAVAHGSAAASLPGTTPPTPDLVDTVALAVTRLS